MNWKLKKRRWKTAFGELDLLFEKQKTKLGVEVKFLSGSFDLSRRVSMGQIQRLIRINTSLSERWIGFRLLIFLVNEKQTEILGLEEFY